MSDKLMEKWAEGFEAECNANGVDAKELIKLALTFPTVPGRMLSKSLGGLADNIAPMVSKSGPNAIIKIIQKLIGAAKTPTAHTLAAGGLGAGTAVGVNSLLGRVRNLGSQAVDTAVNAAEEIPKSIPSELGTGIWENMDPRTKAMLLGAGAGTVAGGTIGAVAPKEKEDSRLATILKNMSIGAGAGGLGGYGGSALSEQII